MGKLELSGRLLAIAAFVGPGERVADVGTDHGYIPVWLAQRGYSGLVATDLRQGPLDRAKASAALYGVTEQITFQCTDGLSGIDGDCVDTVIVAGMGGETICHILGAAPWTRQGKKLILQPMSKPEILVAWLGEQGYALTAADLAAENGKLYCIYCAQGGSASPVSLGDSYLPPVLLQCGSPLLEAYIDEKIDKLERAVRGLAAGRRPQDQARLQILREALAQCKARKERYI